MVTINKRINILNFIEMNSSSSAGDTLRESKGKAQSGEAEFQPVCLTTGSTAPPGRPEPEASQMSSGGGREKEGVVCSCNGIPYDEVLAGWFVVGFFLFAF